ALLQDRVPPVPQCQGQAQPLVDVAESGQAVLTPPVRLRPGMIVRQVIPRVAVGAVVLADRAPLPLADVRPPPVPLPGLQQPVLQPAEPGDPVTFRTHHCSLIMPWRGIVVMVETAARCASSRQAEGSTNLSPVAI